MIDRITCRLPSVRNIHSWPSIRFDIKHPKREPYALIGPIPICAGGHH